MTKWSSSLHFREALCRLWAPRDLACSTMSQLSPVCTISSLRADSACISCTADRPADDSGMVHAAGTRHNVSHAAVVHAEKGSMGSNHMPTVAMCRQILRTWFSSSLSAR